MHDITVRNLLVWMKDCLGMSKGSSWYERMVVLVLVKDCLGMNE
jgi:hypothetical protein